MPAECVTAGPTWYNEPFEQQTGAFEVEFDVRPSVSLMDGVIGLSSAPSTTYSGFAMLVRFNSLGNIDVRNGGNYQALATIPYAGGTTYHFRIRASLSEHTYSVYVRPAALTQETTLASSFAFRSEQADVTSLANWATTASSGSHSVCNFSVETLPPEPPPTPDTQAPGTPTDVRATALASYQVNVNWNASSDNVGVTGYQIYRDGHLAGTSARHPE